MADISNNIRRLRTGRGLSQAQLAEKVGVTRQTISKWESGSSFPDIEMVRHLAEALHTDMDALLYPVSSGKRRRKRSEALPGSFILLSLAVFLFLFFVVGVNAVIPIFRKIFGSDISRDPFYLIFWGIILLVIYIGICTALITEYVTDMQDDLADAAEKMEKPNLQ